ncbi:SPOC domain [Musa troglodytarum]|uniref:SPOC domain n=1 Tax=Musa troglodytarum TaxID=320322 RepID=A0A9E7HJF1_9LILI|nr:SPOC domain [Musa troglodytarum]
MYAPSSAMLSVLLDLNYYHLATSSVATMEHSVSTFSPRIFCEEKCSMHFSMLFFSLLLFCSGEKAQDIRWCDLLEVKGKVRLQAFEKFIQELPRSRTRALMVISLCWKAGSSISGLTGMKEVAKVYQENGRVGFAQICPGIDLYVCPRSETIITILAKFGFFKGMAAVEEDQNSLIGCVVWRRGFQSLDSASKASDRKVTSLVEKPLSSSEILETNSPVLKKQDEHSKQTLLGTRQHDGMQCQHLPETRSNNADNASHLRTESKSRESSSVDCSSKSVSVLHIASSLPYNSPIVPVQISPPQMQELRSKECLKSPLLCAVEGRQTVLGSEPARSLLLQSSQMLPESHQGNVTCSENSTYPSSYPDTLMQSAPSMPCGSIPARLQTTLKPFSSSREDPTSSVSNDGNYIMRFKQSEAPAMSSEPSQTTLPGPPPLPPEVLKRIIQARAAAVAKETNEGVVMIEIPVGHVSEPKKFSMVIGPSPALPGPPSSLPQSLSVCPSPVDVDDLPEFDFSSTSKFIESPGNKYPWSSYHITEVHPFNKQLPSDMGHNLTPRGSTTMQPIEASQRHQFPGEATNYYQENPKRTKFQKPIVDNKVAVRTSLSCDQPSLDADQGSVDPRYSSSSLRKYCWDDDDDDDMPEWCPPDLEHFDRNQTSTAVNLSSPVHNRELEFARRRSFISPLSTSSCPTGSHGLPRGYLHGIQGFSPLNHNPTAPVHTRSAAGFDHSIQRTPLVQRNQFVRLSD